MAAPTRVDSTTSISSITVQWTALTSPDNGDSDITSYNLQWDRGTQGFLYYDLLGATPYTTMIDFTVTNGVVASQTYRFKVRARNLYGWGDFSFFTTVKAANKASIMSAPITSIDSATGHVKISWTAPNNNGDDITAYNVYIGNFDSTTWTIDSTNCGSTTVPSLLTGLYCLVPMSILTASPYSLAFNQLILAKISATNSFGEQTLSPANPAGALVRRVPDAMSTVTLTASTRDSMTVSWSALSGSASGNSAVTAYELRWDSGSGSTIYLLSESLSTSYTVTGLTAGITYKYKVRAKNIYGYGAYSTDASFIASDVPSVMAILTTSLVSSTKVRITWTAPAANFATIDQYDIRLLISTAGIYV